MHLSSRTDNGNNRDLGSKDIESSHRVGLQCGGELAPRLPALPADSFVNLRNKTAGYFTSKMSLSWNSTELHSG